ncbi:OB-fold protein [Corallococcus carmarthensis]|uniref:Uncharacterized protein n=1 Tax=Corallococcus carmarthensis TaxID=2316728 RepID=A0A3A8KLH2_9BACT|nr:hypothetical protein [Corallococcus carmarthensis]RKH05065.1 hypothetical protein D7X32_09105 [Corallococcus carmarthensis]
MRAWWLVAVLTVVGCKQEAGRAPEQVAAAPSDTSGPAARAPSPPPAPAAPGLILVGPRQLWEAYAENEVAADMKYRSKQVEVTGLIQDIAKDATDNIVISLDVGEMMSSVMCLVPDEQMQAVAELAKGQLVAFHGTVRGLLLKRPVIKDCRVAWAGPKAKDKIDKESARLFARSVESCSFQLMLRLRGPNMKRADGGVVTNEELRALAESPNTPVAKMIARARADLADAGINSVSCEQPALVLPIRCDEGEAQSKHPAPECRLQFVDAVINEMQH